MIEWIWGVIARFLARPVVTAWLIRRAERTPYSHLPGYMERYWLFNAFENNRWHVKWLPSIRLHRILREDRDRYRHNHPWTFRSIILRGAYLEQRAIQDDQLTALHRSFGVSDGEITEYIWRAAGETYKLDAEAFHSIRETAAGEVLTLFITWRYQHTWGFKTENGFVPWRKYLGIE